MPKDDPGAPKPNSVAGPDAAEEGEGQEEAEEECAEEDVPIDAEQEDMATVEKEEAQDVD